MKINLRDLTEALKKVKGLAEQGQKTLGIMLDISETREDMRVCYSDGSRAITELLDVTAEDGDISGRIVLPYDRFLSIIDMCQPIAGTKCEEVSISYENDSNICTIKADKTMQMYRDKEEDTGTAGAGIMHMANTPDAGGELKGEQVKEMVASEMIEEIMEELELVDKKVASFEQKLTYELAGSSVKYGALDRLNYEQIFKCIKADGTESEFDTWNRDEFKKILSRCSEEKNKVIYVSPSSNRSGVVNLNSTVIVPFEPGKQHSLKIQTSMAKAIIEMISREDSDTILVASADGRYITIKNEDDTVGMWFDGAPLSRPDVKTIEICAEKDYSFLKLIVTRAAMLNAITCAASLVSDERTTIEFSDKSGEAALCIKSVSKGGAGSGDFEVMLEGSNTPSMEVLKDIKLPISIKPLQSAVAASTSYCIAIDISQDESLSKYMRVSELDYDGDELKMGCMTFMPIGK